MTVSLTLDGKRALVTGGATGIGYGIARRLLEAGATVMIVGRREAHLQSAVQSLRSTIPGSSISGIQCDVTIEDDVARAIEASGGEDLSIAIANAGGGKPGPLLSQSTPDWKQVLDVNVIGTALTIKHAGKAMMKHGGVVIAISSQSSLRPSKYNAMYSVSKAGVDMLVRCAAIELAPFAIRVNGIRPGIVLSEQSERVRSEPFATLIDRTLLGRHGSPEEIGDCVLYLGSDLGRWVTGQVISVCGGLSVSDCDDMSVLALSGMDSDSFQELTQPPSDEG